MECFGNIEKILAESVEKDDVFRKICSTEEFISKPSGVIAYYISKKAEKQDNEAICSFFDYIVDNEQKNIDSFLVFWLRISNSDNIEYIINSLEKKSETLSNIQNLSPTTFIRLIEKIETCVLPLTKLELSEQMSSKQLISNESELSRSKRYTLLAGRVYTIAARIFPPFKFTGKTNSPQFAANSDLLGASIQKMATKDFTQFESNQILDFLEKQTINPDHKTLKRLPPKPSACVEGLDSSRFGYDLLLIIALEGLIHSHEPAKYKQYVLNFASLLHLPGEELIEIVNRSVKNEEDSHFEFGKELGQGIDVNGECSWADIAEEEFCPNFEIPEDKPIDVQKPEPITPESALQEIIQFAGEDKTNWFAGDELKQWRAARLCVANFMDDLNPEAFEIVK